MNLSIWLKELCLEVAVTIGEGGPPLIALWPERVGTSDWAITVVYLIPEADDGNWVDVEYQGILLGYKELVVKNGEPYLRAGPKEAVCRENAEPRAYASDIALEIAETYFPLHGPNAVKVHDENFAQEIIWWGDGNFSTFQT